VLDKASLTRIRDNQRRSRARKKEYVQELEQRLRVYEQQGVEASTEIQQAARRVVGENRKLRFLLNEQGINDSSIESYLQSSGTIFGSTSHGPASTEESASQALDRLLVPRHPSFGGGVTPLPSSSEFDREVRRNSLTFHSPSMDASANTPSLNIATQEVRHSAPTHTYGSLGSSDDMPPYRQDLSTLSSSNRQKFDIAGIASDTTSHRPDVHLSRQHISDPARMWTEAPQVSPDSTMRLQPGPFSQGHTYLNRPVQFAQHQAPSFSSPWPSHLGSGPSTSSSSILSDGFVPIVPNEPSHSEDYGDRVVDDAQDLDDTVFHNPSKQFSTRNMRP
jgi:hypothetical protein